MHIFIDEAGTFISPAAMGPPAYSLVLALVVPTSNHENLCYEFLRLRDTWSNNSVEIKGSKLDETQCSDVALLLAKHDALVEVQIIDMGLHDVQCIENFKEKQAQAVTANLTPRHQPTLVRQLAETADTFRGMANQLFVQAFLMMQLVIEVCEVGILYHVQRRPEELASFKWVIDQKDRTLTAMEKTWSTFILPAGEAQSGKKPAPRIIGCDYSHFTHYEIHESTADAEWQKKISWMRANYKIEQAPGEFRASDWKKLVSEDRAFEDSKVSLGLQLADIAATSLRRALNGNLQKAGWEPFGRLLIHKRAPSFLMLGESSPRSSTLEPMAELVWNRL